MANALVFATYDIKPEEWGDFAQAAAIKGTDIKPYILVYSCFPQDTTSRTNDIAAVVKSELKSATYQELRTLFRKIVGSEESLTPALFLILDEESARDREVLIVDREAVWVNEADGTRMECDPESIGEENADQYKQKVIWRRWRVSFEKAEFYWIVLSRQGPFNLESDDYFQKCLQDIEIGPFEDSAAPP
ncbi:hypothetical protein EV356DRAFT_513457 [Viridothelium virens]|uniref:Uncharacterized protein n=1 Tax=Viridothelium virens TaxID=1048519 RepID=A0A6A6HCW6_VIRVR|nr:hypothetical protein EV356DRAFT_513457 [Viridothelium virens]